MSVTVADVNSNNFFAINNKGSLTIPTNFMAGNNTWTIAFTIESYQVNTARSFCRVARGNNDVPSIFYKPEAKGFMVKLGSTTIFSTNAFWYDSNIFTPWSGQGTALIFNFPSNEKTTFVFKNDGEYISLWMNDAMIMKQLSSNYVPKYYASTFSIGDNAGVGYDMLSMECSMLKAWDYALTDSEIKNINK